MVGLFYGILLLSAKMFKTLADGRTLYERRFGEPKAWSYRLVAIFEYHADFCKRAVKAPLIWEESLPCKCALVAVRI